MPVTVKRLKGEPILVARMTGYITCQDIHHIYDLSNQLITDADKKIYRITDVREADSSFTEMIKCIQRPTQKHAASTEDPRVQVIFIGINNWNQFFRNTMQNRGVDIAIFMDMDKALQAVRLMIARDKRANKADYERSRKEAKYACKT